MAHEILPVRSVMHSWGKISALNWFQPGCGASESVRHLVWECSTAVDQWATAGSLQFPYLPVREVLTAQLVLYEASKGGNQTVAHYSRHQRRHMDLQKLAGKEAHADPPRGCDPDGGRPGRSHKEESPLCPFGRRSRSHTGKGQSGGGGLTLRVRQVGRSSRVGVSSEHHNRIQRDQICLGERNESW